MHLRCSFKNLRLDGVQLINNYLNKNKLRNKLMKIKDIDQSQETKILQTQFKNLIIINKNTKIINNNIIINNLGRLNYMVISILHRNNTLKTIREDRSKFFKNFKSVRLYLHSLLNMNLYGKIET